MQPIRIEWRSIILKRDGKYAYARYVLLDSEKLNNFLVQNNTDVIKVYLYLATEASKHHKKGSFEVFPELCSRLFLLSQEKVVEILNTLELQGHLQLPGNCTVFPEKVALVEAKISRSKVEAKISKAEEPEPCPKPPAPDLHPFSFLFIATEWNEDEDFNPWVQRCETSAAKKLTEKYTEEYLVEEIPKAYMWDSACPPSKKKKSIGLFLQSWLKRSEKDASLNVNPQEKALYDFFKKSIPKKEWEQYCE